ncbi:MAG: sialate O-acetylesterase [Bacteroidetes bacterium]|nr:sialate O-acetylesterase [Bacteroidota bacterium]
MFLNIRFRFIATLILINGSVNAQQQKTILPDSLFSTYYLQRVSHFKTLPQTKGDIIFLGNSITDGAEWNELFSDVRIKNRGISGDISAGVIKRIDEVTNRQPSKLFLMIGTNDLAKNIPIDSVIKNILWIADYVRQQSPATKLFVQSILPVNEVFKKFNGHTTKRDLIEKVNASLQWNAKPHHYTFIDLYTPFCNREGKLDTTFTNDGLHLTGEGYLLWKRLVALHVDEH